MVWDTERRILRSTRSPRPTIRHHTQRAAITHRAHRPLHVFHSRLSGSSSQNPPFLFTKNTDLPFHSGRRGPTATASLIPRSGHQPPNMPPGISSTNPTLGNGMPSTSRSALRHPNSQTTRPTTAKLHHAACSSAETPHHIDSCPQPTAEPLRNTSSHHGSPSSSPGLHDTGEWSKGTRYVRLCGAASGGERHQRHLLQWIVRRDPKGGNASRGGFAHAASWMRDRGRAGMSCEGVEEGNAMMHPLLWS